MKETLVELINDNCRPVYTARNILTFNRLYHGGAVEVREPDLKHSAEHRQDFGFGFYCTTVKEQAETWASRTSGGFKIVSVYTWNPSVLNTLRCLEFHDIATEEGLNAWLNEIIRSRREYIPVHDFDIVAGPMSYDFVWSAVEEFAWAESAGMDLTLYRKKVRNAALGFTEPTQQIVFCTQRAIDALIFLSSYSV